MNSCFDFGDYFFVSIGFPDGSSKENKIINKKDNTNMETS